MRTEVDVFTEGLDTLWRPFTQHALQQRPVVMVEGRGCLLVDDQGNEYLDAMAGLWCVNVGYGEERLVEAAAQQMRRLPYTSLVRPAPVAISLAERLKEKLPGDLNHVVFVNSGSEAVETALKIARQYAKQVYPNQNRHKVIARYRGYHGWTMGALGATGQTARKASFEPTGAGYLHVRPPDLFRLFPDVSPSQAAQELAAELERIIEYEGAETIAAFIGEPIIGGGGVIVPPDEYWPLIRDVCTRHGILMIHDEVITGFGRTGTMFGCEQWGVVPDIMTMAKGISSGYVPLAATAATDAVFDAFKGDLSEQRQFSQLSTYGGHPVACAVALENLSVIEDRGLVANSQDMGLRLGQGLAALKDRHTVVGDVRGKGLIWGVELVQPGTREPLPAQQVNQVLSQAQSQGVIFGKNVATVSRLECVVTISPPLIIDAAGVDRIIATLDDAISTVAV